MAPDRRASTTSSDAPPTRHRQPATGRRGRAGPGLGLRRGGLVIHTSLMPATYETIESDGRAFRIGDPERVGPSGSGRLGSRLELAEGDEREASSEPRRARPSRRKK
jgi:hypothetical protein